MGVVGSSILGIGRSREKYFKFLIGFQFVALGHCEKRKGEGGGGEPIIRMFWNDVLQNEGYDNVLSFFFFF